MAERTVRPLGSVQNVGENLFFRKLSARFMIFGEELTVQADLFKPFGSVSLTEDTMNRIGEIVGRVENGSDRLINLSALFDQISAIVKDDLERKKGKRR